MRVEPGHAVERRLERHGDERLDVVGRQAGRFGLDFDQRRRELREDVERRRAQRPARRPRRAAPPARRRRCGCAARARPASASVPRSEFGAEQLGGAGGDDLRARRRCRARSRRGRRRVARSARVVARRRCRRGPRTPTRRRGCRRAPTLRDDEALAAVPLSGSSDHDALTRPQRVTPRRAARSRGRRTPPTGRP